MLTIRTCHLKSPRSGGGNCLYPTNQYNELWQLTSTIILKIPSAVKRLKRNDTRQCYLKHNAADLRDVICTSGWIINKAKLWERGWTLQPLLASASSSWVIGSNRCQGGVITRCGAGRHLLDDGGHFITILTDGAYLSVFKQNNSKSYEPI